MSNTTPLRTVIVGCGMISAGGYQPRSLTLSSQSDGKPRRIKLKSIELVGYYRRTKL